MPRPLSSFARFRKKETVIGIMGQMQGIISARRPPTKPSRKMANREREVLPSESLRVCSSSVTGYHKVLEERTLAEDWEAESVGRTDWLNTSDADSSDAGAASVAEAVAADEAGAPVVVADGIAADAAADGEASAGFSALAAYVPLKENSTGVGGRHDWSLQAPYCR